MIQLSILVLFFSFQVQDGIRAGHVTGVQTCALPICIDGRFQHRHQAFAYRFTRLCGSMSHGLHPDSRFIGECASADPDRKIVGLGWIAVAVLYTKSTITVTETRRGREGGGYKCEMVQ